MSAALSPAKLLQAKLAEVDIPARDINCYGRQIMITTAGEESARRWADLVGKFSAVQSVTQGMDDIRNVAGSLRHIKVWRVWATVPITA